MKEPKLDDLMDEPSPFQNRDARNQKQHNWDVLRRFGKVVGGFLTNSVSEINNAISNADDRMDDIEDRYNKQIAGNTDLKEAIDARDGKATLLQKEKSQDNMINTAIMSNQLLEKTLFNRRPLSEKVGVHAYSESIIYDNERNNNSSFRTIKEMGFNHVRFGLTWSWIEKQKGIYDYNYQDKLVNAAVDCGLIPMMSPQGDESVPYQKYDEKKEAIIPFILASVKHYAGKGVIWEGWNEANYGHSWLGQEGGANKSIINDWTDFNSKMGKIIRDNDPNSLFLAGALNAQKEVGVDADMFWEWGPVVDHALKNGLVDYADALSFHPYTFNSEPELLLNTNSRNRTFGQMEALIAKNSSRKIPLAVTEFGYSTTLKSMVKVDEETQARWVVRSMFVMDILNAPLITLFAFKDNDANEAHGNLEDGFGFVRGDFKTLKPSGILFKKIIGQLEGFKFYERVNVMTNNDYVLRYTLAGKQRIAYWHTDDESDHTVIVNGREIYVTNTPQVTDEFYFDESTPINQTDNTDLRKLETQGQFGETYVRLSPIDTLGTMVIPGIYSIGALPSDWPDDLPEDSYYLKVEGAQTLRSGLKQVLVGTVHNNEFYRTKKDDGTFSDWESASGIVERDSIIKPSLGDGKLGIKVVRLPQGKLVTVSIDLRNVEKAVNGTFTTGMPVPMHATGVGVPLQFDVATAADKTRYRTFNIDLDGRLTSNFATQALGSGEEIIGLYQYRAKR